MLPYRYKNWKKVPQRLQQLSHEYSIIEQIIHEQIINLLKKSRPNNYQDIIEQNKYRIDKISERVTKSPKCTIKFEIEELIRNIGIKVKV